ncbi:MAG TPA: amidohydrolase family protein [Ramlibacter sp.]|nr:amidohydrolase family protein [Ramlibacter sp.]
MNLQDLEPTVVIRNGTVVTGAPGAGAQPGMDVWIRGDTIAEIRASGQRPTPAGCKVIDATDAIVMPGLIDSHRHLWQTTLRAMSSDLIAPEYRHQLREALVPLYRPEDVYIATLAGALEALDSGVTTVLDWAHIMNSPEHADASIDALRRSGIRAVFAHSAPNDQEATLWWSNSARPHPRDARRVRQVLSDDSARVTMALGARAPQLVQRDVRVHDWRLARELGLRIVTDGGIGGGLWGGRTYPIRLLAEDGLLGPDCCYVHCNNLAEDEYRLIADSGGAISMSPCGELHVGFGMPATIAALAHGIRPALSIDSVIFVAGDMFATMRATLGLQRGMLGWEATQRGVGVGPWQLTTADVLEFATFHGAAALGLAGRTGALQPGQQADIVLLNTRSLRLAPNNNPVASIVLQATPADVKTVLVAGQIVKEDGRLTDWDEGSVVRDLVKSRDWLVSQGGARLGASVRSRLVGTGLPGF